MVNGGALPPIPPGARVGLAGIVRATAIALEELGRPAANTAILGAFAGLTRWVSREALLEVLPDYFDGDALDGNRRALERGYREATLVTVPEAAHAVP